MSSVSSLFLDRSYFVDTLRLRSWSFVVIVEDPLNAYAYLLSWALPNFFPAFGGVSDLYLVSTNIVNKIFAKKAN
jgi:hypothetical protein